MGDVINRSNLVVAVEIEPGLMRDCFSIIRITVERKGRYIF